MPGPHMPGPGMPGPGLSGPGMLGARGVPGAKAPSPLDAPLTEAQIATLPPALQAVLRKKLAEKGSSISPGPPPGAPPGASPGASLSASPGAPSGASQGASLGAGAVSGSALEPTAPAAEELTPEQRTVVAQLRSLHAHFDQNQVKDSWSLQLVRC